MYSHMFKLGKWALLFLHIRSYRNCDMVWNEKPEIITSQTDHNDMINYHARSQV